MDNIVNVTFIQMFLYFNAVEENAVHVLFSYYKKECRLDLICLYRLIVDFHSMSTGLIISRHVHTWYVWS